MRAAAQARSALTSRSDGAAMRRFATALVVALSIPPAFAVDDPGKSGALYDEGVALDARYFDAFNQCDVATLEKLTDAQIQFYHDKDGLAVGRDPFLKAVKANVCGKFTRVVDKASIEVWPIPNYGMMMVGVHRFHHADGSRDGIGKFMTLWAKRDGEWKMTQTFSYAHAEAPVGSSN
jgi:hypothetical protein